MFTSRATSCESAAARSLVLTSRATSCECGSECAAADSGMQTPVSAVPELIVTARPFTSCGLGSARTDCDGSSNSTI